MHKKNQQIFQQLIRMLTKAYMIRNDEDPTEKQLQALSTLAEAYELFTKIKTHAKVDIDQYRGYFGYTTNLYNLESSLKKGDYMTACIKLENMIALDKPEEKRVKENIVLVLQKYLHLEGEKNDV